MLRNKHDVSAKYAGAETHSVLIGLMQEEGNLSMSVAKNCRF